MIFSNWILAWMNQIGWVLVHFLWEGALIGLVTGMALVVLRAASARIRYLLLCAALLACGLAPCVTWALLDKGNEVAPVAAPNHETVLIPAAKPISVEISHADVPSLQIGGAPAPSSAWNLEKLARLIQAAFPYLVTLWSLGVSLLSLRLLYGWIQLQKWCASGILLKDQDWADRMKALATRMGVRRTIVLLESTLVEVPTVVGWLRPVILFPVTFFAGLPPDQIEAILAHELAHIRRHDYLVNLLQIAIETLLFYHPVVWWISRMIRQERENCCDDLALQIVGNKATYARALAALEESRSLPMALTMAATGGSLLQRIKRIAGIGAPSPTNRRWTVMGGAFLLVLLIAGIAAISFPIWQARQAPQLLFVVDGKKTDLSQPAQTKIIAEIEAAVLAVSSDSNKEPEKFERALTPKLIEEDGLYFRVVYPQTKTFATPDGPLQAKEIYLTSGPYENGNPLGDAPGGIVLVSNDGRLTQVALGSDTPLLNLTFNADVYSHLPDQMKWQVGQVLPGYLNMANAEGLDPELRLVAAANAGDLTELKKLLAQGVKLNQVPPCVTNLLFASGSPEVAEFLIDQGIKVDTRNQVGDTALISICRNDSGRRKQELVAPTVRVLLKHGADPNAVDAAHWTPLIVAQDGATVDALVEYGADVRAKPNGEGPLDQLDNNYRDVSYYKALAAHGLAIDNHDYGAQLLVSACRSWQPELAAWLLGRGIDPNIAAVYNAQDPQYRFTLKPLTEAAAGGSAIAAKMLIDHGAKTDEEATNAAIENERYDVLKVFWENGARNFSKLFYEVSQDASAEKLEALLNKGVAADPPQDRYKTPLALAAERGNLPAVQVLVRHGADPNRKLEKFPDDKHSFGTRTPLAVAASAGRDEVVQYLLQKGAHPDVDTLKLTLYTFYHRLRRAPTDETYHRIIQELVDAGACKNVPREQMADLLLWTGEGAGDWRDLPLLKILLASGLDPTAKNAAGLNAINRVQARYDKIADAETRDHLMQEIDLLKTSKAETDDKMEEKSMLVHIQNSDGSPLTGTSIKAEGPDLSAELTTGADGMAMISRPKELPRYLNVHIRKEGFVPKLVSWSLDQPNFTLPSDFTLKMEKAQTIGGVVKNERGQPVAGAKVVLIIRGSSMGGLTQQVFNDIWEERVTTDAEGKWHFDEAPSNLGSLQVTLEHPDYVSNERISPRPGDDEFKNQTALLILHQGVPVNGIVTDEKGKPIADVDVNFGEAGSGSITFPNTKTDAAGHFRFGGLSINRSFGVPILTFTSDEHAPEMVELTPLAIDQTLKVVLKPGKKLSLRFTDQQGHPVKDVTLCADRWREHRPFRCARFQSNADGQVVWEHAPDDPITYALLSDTFQNQNLVLQPKDGVQTILLKRPTAVSGRVLDATTRQPISQYSLIFGDYYPEKDPNWSGWARGAALQLNTDSYRYVFQYRAAIRNPTNVPDTEGFHRIRIEAAGYEPGVSRPIANDEEAVSIDFLLKPATAIHGIVTAPDGSPVKNAQIVVAGPGNAVRITDGISDDKWDQQIITTNEKGEYDLPAQDADLPIAVIQPNAGYFTTNYTALKASPNVRLLPWGELDISTSVKKDANRNYSIYYADELQDSYQSKRIRFAIDRPSESRDGLDIYRCLVAGAVNIGQLGKDAKTIQIKDGETQRFDWKTGPPAVINPAAGPMQTATLVVHVVNGEGRPVSGAIVTPVGLRSQERPGSYLSISPSGRTTAVQTGTTDGEGNATISFPAHPLENMNIGVVVVTVDHPDTCSARVELNVDAPRPVSLVRGNKWSFAISPIPGVRFSQVYADVVDPGQQAGLLKWDHSSDDQSISTHLPDGQYLVRLVGVTAEGKVYFSMPFQIASNLAPMSAQAAYEVKEGGTIRGKLDDSIPRPVKGGWVAAEVTTPAPDPNDGSASWRASADIAEDGSFVLNNLPSGTLEIVAGCHGYVSKDTRAEPIGGIRQAQAIPETEAQPITLPMEPTGDARVTIQTPDGKPLAGAIISFSPNQMIGRGTSILGMRYNSLEMLQNREETLAKIRSTTRRYSAKTDANGVAIVTGLPPGAQNYFVQSTSFDMPLASGRMGTLTVASATEVSTQVTLAPKGRN